MLMSWRKTVSKAEYKDAEGTKGAIDKLAELLPEKLKYIYDSDA